MEETYDCVSQVMSVSCQKFGHILTFLLYSPINSRELAVTGAAAESNIRR